MSVATVRKAAEDMQVSFKVAAWNRCRYLRERLRQCADDLERFEKFANSGAPWDEETVLISNRLMNVDEVVLTARELRELCKLVNGAEARKERITDDQVETAKATPVDSLIEFVRGKAKAWCHDDRSPSLYHGTRLNIAVCPVCDKKFGPVDILMTRDGLSFVEAVKQLAA